MTNVMDILNPIDPVKIIMHKDKIMQVLNNELPIPVTIGLDISNYCNNNCSWCLFKEYRNTHLCNMPEDLIFKSLLDLKNAGVIAVCFSGGGEPTMNQFCNEAILYGKEIGLEISLNTNGLLLDKISEEALKTLKYIRISLDAGSNETHNLLHCPNETNIFDKIISTIKNICTKKLTTVGVGFLVHKSNCHEAYVLAKILDDIGCDYLQFRPIKNILLDKESEDIFLEQLVLIKYNIKMKIYETFTKMQDTINKKLCFSNCYMKNLVANIAPDGYVYACCELRGIKPIGNIKYDNFFEIWHSSNHKNIIQNIDVTKCPPCKYAGANEIIEKYIINDALHMNFI